MVSICYDWPPSKWFLQGILTSILSGLGFVFFTLAFEYAKKYSRERKEREQQFMLQKLLRGEVAVEWKNNSKAVVPTNNAYSLPNVTRASVLLNAYGQYGGFLGFGRGYYAYRNKNMEDMENDIDDKGRMIKYTNWSDRGLDKCDSQENAHGEADTAIRALSRSDTTSIYKDEASWKFRDLATTSASAPFCGLKNAQIVEPPEKQTEEGTISKNMCKEICYKIVKEHPFIVPFLRSDLLRELQMEVPNEPADANSCLSSNSPSTSKRISKMYKKPVCKQSNSETSPRDSQVNIKRLRSVNRKAQRKSESPCNEHHQLGSLVPKTVNTIMKSRRVEPAIHDTTSIVREENRPFNGLCSRPRYRKNLKRGKSYSVLDKRIMEQSGVKTKPAEIALDASNRTKQCTTLTPGYTCEDIAEKGSSVDPSTLPATGTDRMPGSTSDTGERSERNNDKDETVVMVPTEDVALNNSKQSEINFLEKDNEASSQESRIKEIVSALTLWGSPIKSAGQQKKAESMSIGENSSHANVQNPFENQPGVKDTTTSINSDSKVLLDLIQGSSTSMKKRKLLRQISCVLKTNRSDCKQTPEGNPSSEETTKSEMSWHQDKERKKVDISKGTGTKLSRGKGFTQGKGRSLLKQRSFLKRHSSSPISPEEHKRPLNKQVTAIKPENSRTSGLWTSNVNTLPPSALENEQREKSLSSVGPVNKLRKPSRHNVKKRVVRKIACDAANEAEWRKGLIKNNSPSNDPQLPELQFPLQNSSLGQGDTEQTCTAPESNVDNGTGDNKKDSKNESIVGHENNESKRSKSKQLNYGEAVQKECQDSAINDKLTDRRVQGVTGEESLTSKKCDNVPINCLTRKSRQRVLECRSVATNTASVMAVPTKLSGHRLALWKNSRCKYVKAPTAEKPKPGVSNNQRNIGKYYRQKSVISNRTDSKHIISVINHKKNMISGINEPKYLLSNTSEEKSLISFSQNTFPRQRQPIDDVFIQAAHTPAPTDRNDDIRSYKSTSISNKLLLRTSSTSSKNNQRKTQKQMLVAEKYSHLLSSTKNNKQQTRMPMKYGQIKKGGYDTLVLNKFHCKSQVVNKLNRQQSQERGTRFDPYLRDKQLVNYNPPLVRTLERHNKDRVELKQERRQALNTDLLLQAQVSQSKTSYDTKDIHIVYNRPMVLLRSQTPMQQEQDNNAHRPSSTLKSTLEDLQEFSPDLTSVSSSSSSSIQLVQRLEVTQHLPALNRQNNRAQVDYFSNKLQKTEDENGNGKRDKQIPNLCQTRGLLKKSKLDDVVKNMLHSSPH